MEWYQKEKNVLTKLKANNIQTIHEYSKLN